MYVYYWPDCDRLWFTPEAEHPWDLPRGTIKGEILTRGEMTAEKIETIRDLMRKKAEKRKAP